MQSERGFFRAVKKDGKTVMKTHAMVSSDGKTRTLTSDGTDPQGHNVHNVVVFEKGCGSGSRIQG
jgi:hypothetical protein